MNISSEQLAEPQIKVGANNLFLATMLLLRSEKDHGNQKVWLTILLYLPKNVLRYTALCNNSQIRLYWVNR